MPTNQEIFHLKVEKLKIKNKLKERVEKEGKSFVSCILVVKKIEMKLVRITKKQFYRVLVFEWSDNGNWVEISGFDKWTNIEIY